MKRYCNRITSKAAQTGTGDFIQRKVKQNSMRVTGVKEGSAGVVLVHMYSTLCSSDLFH